MDMQEKVALALTPIGVVDACFCIGRRDIAATVASAAAIQGRKLHIRALNEPLYHVVCERSALEQRAHLFLYVILQILDSESTAYVASGGASLACNLSHSRSFDDEEVQYDATDGIIL